MGCCAIQSSLACERTSDQRRSGEREVTDATRAQQPVLSVGAAHREWLTHPVHRSIAQSAAALCCLYISTEKTPAWSCLYACDKDGFFELTGDYFGPLRNDSTEKPR
jgi:hypothetical protein